MNRSTHVDKYPAFIDAQIHRKTKQTFIPPKLRLAITLSRQHGCDAMAVAEELAAFLLAQSPSPEPWVIFDKNLAEKILEEHDLPKELARFMPEDSVPAIQDAIEELLGLHPSSRTLLHQSTETILRLADHGHVILVGRASNTITRSLKNVFHVRLVAPLEHRVQQIMARCSLDEQAALKRIQQVDLGRKRYLKNHFNSDINDSLQYDLVINTARIPHCEVAHLISEASTHWAETL